MPSSHDTMLAIVHAVQGFRIGDRRPDARENDARIDAILETVEAMRLLGGEADAEGQASVHAALVEMWEGPVQDLVYYHDCQHPGRDDEELAESRDLWDLDLTVAVARVYEALDGIFLDEDAPTPDVASLRFLCAEAARLVDEAETVFWNHCHGDSVVEPLAAVAGVLSRATIVSHQYRLAERGLGLLPGGPRFETDVDSRFKPGYFLDDDGLHRIDPD